MVLISGWEFITCTTIIPMFVIKICRMEKQSLYGPRILVIKDTMAILMKYLCAV